MKKLMLALALVTMAAGVTGCCGSSKEKASASSYCRMNKADDACKNCCLSQRATSSAVSNGACKCY